VVSRLADRFGVRVVLIFVAFALGSVCFGMAFASGGLAFIVLFAALRALGQGSMPINATLLAAQWFVRRRGVAIAVMGLGFAASNALLPPITRLMNDSFGWREAYIGLGIMVWLLVIPGAILVVRNTPEERGLYPDGDPSPPRGEPAGGLQPGVPDKRRVLTSLSFWQLAIPLATPAFVITAVIFHQTSIFGEQGLSAANAAMVFVPYAITSAICSIVAGLFIDRFGPRPAFLANMGVLSSALLLLLFVVSSPATATVYGLVLGATGGTAQVISGVTWAHFYGRHGLGRIQGSATMVGISGAAIGPLPLALFEGATGSFQTGLAAMLVLPVLSAFAVLLARPRQHAQRTGE
jgi:MFS family permease